MTYRPTVKSILEARLNEKALDAVKSPVIEAAALEVFINGMVLIKFDGEKLSLVDRKDWRIRIEDLPTTEDER